MKSPELLKVVEQELIDKVAYYPELIRVLYFVALARDELRGIE